MTIVETHRSAAKLLPESALYIGGERVTTSSLGHLDRVDPTTGLSLASFPLAGAQEVDMAVQAARKAFPAW